MNPVRSGKSTPYKMADESMNHVDYQTMGQIGVPLSKWCPLVAMGMVAGRGVL